MNDKELSRFEVTERIGANPYAEVHKAYDHERDGFVAIMQLNPRFRAADAAWEKIWSEVLERVRLKHEYIVSVYDLQRDEARLVMELMRGNLLQVARKGPLEAPVVRTVLARLQALAWMHQCGRLHGDVKPANLLYDREGCIKLSFSPGLMMGDYVPYQSRDFKYTPPELLSPEFGEITTSADLYGLGISGLELLMGPAFDDLVPGAVNSPDPNMAWIRWHSSAELTFPSLATVVSGVPRDIATVIERLLQKPVGDRYESAEAALRDLDTTAQDRLVEAESADAPQGAGHPALVPNRLDAPAEAPRWEPPSAGKPRQAGTARPATGARRRPAGDGLQPWSRPWINKKLENPKIMAAVIGAIAVVTLALIWPWGGDSAAEPPSTQSVTAGVTRQDAKQNGKTESANEEGETKQKPKEPKKPEPELCAKPRGPEPKPNPEKPNPEKSELKSEPEAGPSAKGQERPPSGDPPNQGVKESEGDGPRRGPLPAGFAAVDRAASGSLPRMIRAASLNSRLSVGAAPLEFALIPAGQYQFGAAEPQLGELPQTTVTIDRPFYVSRTEVSNAHFQVFADETGNSWSGGEPNLPAAMSHELAARYADWLTPAAALPSEGQWEIAARLGSQPEAGSKPAPAGTPAGGAFVSLKGAGAEVAPAAVNAGASGAALHFVDNVAEWCRDAYVPGHGEDEAVPGAGAFPVIRGGSFLDPQSRVTFRANADPAGKPDIGLRLVIEIHSQQD